MKLVNFECPGCGAQLNVDADSKQATCQYCGMSFPVDDETQHVKFDGAEQAGYDFEKGRQRAQQEQARPQTVYVQVEAQQPKPKRKTWLWVLGWILIFPVPLTIIMLKNESVKEKLNPKARYAIIAIAWLLYLAIGVFGGGGNNNSSKASESANSTISAATQVSSDSASASSASAADVSSEASVAYAEDSVVNDFIVAYNAISGSPIESVSKGNIRTKYFGYSYGYYLQLLHANGTGKISIDINETNENADVGVPGMRDVFHDAAKTMDTSLSDDDIYGYFDAAVENPSNRGGGQLGSIAVFYSADVDLSSGHSRGYIKLSAL